MQPNDLKNNIYTFIFVLISVFVMTTSVVGFIIFLDYQFSNLSQGMEQLLICTWSATLILFYFKLWKMFKTFGFFCY